MLKNYLTVHNFKLYTLTNFFWFGKIKEKKLKEHEVFNELVSEELEKRLSEYLDWESSRSKKETAFFDFEFTKAIFDPYYKVLSDILIQDKKDIENFNKILEFYNQKIAFCIARKPFNNFQTSEGVCEIKKQIKSLYFNFELDPLRVQSKVIYLNFDILAFFVFYPEITGF